MTTCEKESLRNLWEREGRFSGHLQEREGRLCGHLQETEIHLCDHLRERRLLTQNIVPKTTKGVS